VPTSGTGDLAFTRASTKTRTNAAGNVVDVASGVAAIDYRNADGSLSPTGRLLLEPQRTNLVTFSEQFDDAAWVKTNVSVTANSITSPSGVLNADFVVPNITNSIHRLSNSTASGLCTYSVFAKKGFYKNILVWFDIHSGGIGVNLETLAIFRNENITSYTIDNFGNDWFRISITANIAATATAAIYVYSNDATPRISWVANGSGGLYLWGAQVEAGAYPTTYIPTTTAAVTRVADAASKTGVSSIIGQTQGTIYVNLNIARLNIVAGNIALSNGTDEISIQFPPGNPNNIRAVIFIGGAFPVAIDVPFASAGNYKIAFAYAQNNFAIYVNGVLRGTDTSGNVPACSEIKFIAPLMNGVNNAALFTRRLTNAELAAITTL
jgi:hypothetical protein